MPFPASDLQIRRYAQHLAATLKSAATIDNYISGVRTFHMILDQLPPPKPSESFMLNQTLRGIRVLLARPVRQAAPLTPELLVNMFRFVNVKSQQQLVAWVAILLGFHMMLRKSNLVPDTKFQEGKQLSRKSITISDKALLIEITWSKTIQYKQKKFIIPLIPLPDFRICPYYWVNFMINAIPAHAEDPALCYVKKGTRQPLTYSQLSKWLKLWVAAVGENPKEFSTHSMRVGGATFAFDSDIPGQTIQILGGWASQAYLRYLQLSLDKRVDSMLILANAVEARLQQMQL